MRIHILLVAINLLFCQSVIAQQSRSIINAEGKFEFSFAKKNKLKNSQLHADRMYYSFEVERINRLQGGISGIPLQGKYTSFYRNESMMESGSFLNGLKHSEWRAWSESGTLLEITNWKSGLIHGRRLSYQNGVLVSDEEYKKGVQHGKCNYLVEGEWQTKIFKNGQEKSEKVSVKKNNKNKNTELLFEEVTPPQPEN
jgi:antitoxin component YwqK of YwqJK toxin-antitoxin module